MKIIGLELRVGVGDGMKVLEAKVIPVEITIPHVAGSYSGGPEAEITFHCSEGDVTTPRIRLPWAPNFQDRLSAHEATDLLRKHLEGRVGV